MRNSKFGFEMQIAKPNQKFDSQSSSELPIKALERKRSISKKARVQRIIGEQNEDFTFSRIKKRRV
jgi:hypothetical protein